MRKLFIILIANLICGFAVAQDSTFTVTYKIDPSCNFPRQEAYIIGFIGGNERSVMDSCVIEAGATSITRVVRPKNLLDDHYRCALLFTEAGPINIRFTPKLGEDMTIHINPNSEKVGVANVSGSYESELGYKIATKSRQAYLRAEFLKTQKQTKLVKDSILIYRKYCDYLRFFEEFSLTSDPSTMFSIINILSKRVEPHVIDSLLSVARERFPNNTRLKTYPIILKDTSPPSTVYGEYAWKKLTEIKNYRYAKQNAENEKKMNKL